MKGALGQERLRQRVDITKAPYAEQYPLLLAIYQGKRAVTTPFERNYVVKGDYSAFVDAKGGDFRLRPSAKVFTDIPGFKPLPFEKIGLRVDETRRHLPLKPPVFGDAPTRFGDEVQVGLSTPLRASHVVYTLDGTEPTAASPLYISPVVLTETTLLKARAVGEGANPVLSETVSRRFEHLPLRPVREIRINFQPDGSVPDGWRADTGAAYQVHADGAAYGWSAGNTGASRRRGRHQDPLRDTLVHFTGDMSWRIRVEPGTYSLSVMVGDAEHPSQEQTVLVNGKVLCPGVNLKGGEFRTFTADVKAEGGWITLTSKNVPHGPKLTRMNTLTLAPAGSR